MTVSFDRQASDFDRRAGLPAGVAREIAAALAGLAPDEDGVILDLCAGTGLIGEHLAGGRCRYLGVDVSGPMLAVFRRKLGAGSGGALVRADAGSRWPIAGGSIDVVFLSRAAHLLPPAVLVEEALRVVNPEGGLVVFGGVRGQPDSLRGVLRRKMRQLLAEHGVEGRNASAAQRKLADAFAERGGEVLPPLAAASWTVVDRASEALAAWRAKAGLAGRAVTAEIQEGVLRRLEDWIRQRYGSLDAESEAQERFELAAIRLPQRSARQVGAKS